MTIRTEEEIRRELAQLLVLKPTVVSSNPATLETPAAVAHSNKLLADKRGCHECAWGKVAGCWRCGSR